MSRTRAVVVAALEDYGLVPVEANASGTPTVAYEAGGVLDTQIPEKTGVLFKRQTPDALQSALLRSTEIDWDYQQIRRHALDHFSEEAFFHKVDQVIAAACA
jgi:glycosyltransferase involved in cell wall biosynthesis